jgi:hypothetical protein
VSGSDADAIEEISPSASGGGAVYVSEASTICVSSSSSLRICTVS